MKWTEIDWDAPIKAKVVKPKTPVGKLSKKELKEEERAKAKAKAA